MRRRTALIGLALAWILISGEITPSNVLLALVVAAATVLLLRFSGRAEIHIRPVRFILFAFWYLGATLRATFWVAAATLRLRSNVNAAIVGVANDARGAWELAMLVNLINFMPGTIALAVSDDEETLYVHGLFTGETSVLVDQLVDLQRRLIEVRR